MSQGFHPGRDPSDLKKIKTVEENGEEAEPVRNGDESICEGEKERTTEEGRDTLTWFEWECHPFTRTISGA